METNTIRFASHIGTMRSNMVLLSIAETREYQAFYSLAYKMLVNRRE